MLIMQLDKCMTLRGEPEREHAQSVEQLNVHECYQNVTEHSTTSGHRTETQKT